MRRDWIARLREREAFATAIGATFAAMLAVVMLVASDGRAAAQTNEAVVTMKGEEAFKLLVGNTLRSIATSNELVPTYRYFKNEHIEYDCQGGKFAVKSPKELKVVRWTVGCVILWTALREIDAETV